MHLPPAPGPFTLPMTTERMNWCLDAIGWSVGELSRRLDISDASARQMTTGKRFIPYRVAVWLETLAQMMMSIPQPFLWNQHAGASRERHIGGSGPDIDRIEAAWNLPKLRPSPVAELLGERSNTHDDE